MQKKKLTRFTAIALAVVMTLGGAITALASDATSGTTTGTGTNEGHVNREVVKVILPTVSSDSTPFAYTMDLERLIQETEGKKYADGVTFPEASSDTGVYFNVSGNYANTSEELKVTNQSSVSINLTVEVAASDEATDVTLVSTNAAIATAEDAQLYLALKVGDTVTPIVAGETVSSTVSIAGIADNFKVDVVSDNYVYSPIDSPAAWKTASFSMTGAASEASAEGLTAPTLTVTWRYEDPTGVAGTASLLPYQGTNYLALRGTENARFDVEATSVVVNGKDLSGKAQLIAGYIAIKAGDLVGAGISVAKGTTFEVTYTVDGTKYTASYTYQ